MPWGLGWTRPFPAGARPWFLTDGVLHYVGVHSGVTLGSVWGARFAIDRDFARAAGIRFQPDLGRTRRRLESGDDSTFIRQLRESGGVVVFLPDAPATHTVRPEKGDRALRASPGVVARTLGSAPRRLASRPYQGDPPFVAGRFDSRRAQRRDIVQHRRGRRDRHGACDALVHHEPLPGRSRTRYGPTIHMSGRRRSDN